MQQTILARKNEINQWSVRLDAGWVRFGTKVWVQIPKKFWWSKKIRATIERIDEVNKTILIAPEIEYEAKPVDWFVANALVKELVSEEVENE